MARKDIYFLIEGNEALGGYLDDLGSCLSRLGVTCLVEQSTNKLLKRLSKRKTRIKALMLLASDIGNGIVAKLCKQVPEHAYPEKVVFVKSSYSPITKEQLEDNSTLLERSGIQPICSELTSVSSAKVVKQWL